MSLPISDAAAQKGRPMAIAAMLILLVVCTAAVYYARHVYAPCDDTYIYLVYAKNLFAGNGLTYNGTNVQGFTSTLWMAVLVLGGLLPVGLPRAAESLSVVSGIVLMFVAYSAGRRAGLSPGRALITPVLLAGTFDLVFYMSSGMETVFFTVMVVASSAFILTDAPERSLRGRALPVVLALLMLARPDGALVAMVVLVYLGMATKDWRALVRPIAVTAAIMLPVLIALRLYYGSWLPNTYYAKAGAGLANIGQGWRYFWHFVQAEWPVLILFAAASWLAIRRAGKPAAALVALVVLWFGHIIVQGGDNLVGFRALLPAVPLVYLVVAVGSQRVHGAVVALALVGITTYHIAIYQYGNIVGSSWGFPIREQIALWQTVHDDRITLGEYLRDTYPPGTLMALNAAGVVPYYSEQPTVDMLGLNDPYIARRGDRDFSLVYGHQAGDGDYVIQRRPKVIIFKGLGRGERNYFLSDRQIWRNPNFRREYRPANLPGDVTAFVRRAQ